MHQHTITPAHTHPCAHTHARTHASTHAHTKQRHVFLCIHTTLPTLLLRCFKHMLRSAGVHFASCAQGFAAQLAESFSRRPDSCVWFAARCVGGILDTTHGCEGGCACVCGVGLLLRIKTFHCAFPLHRPLLYVGGVFAQAMAPVQSVRVLVLQLVTHFIKKVRTEQVWILPCRPARVDPYPNHGITSGVHCGSFLVLRFAHSVTLPTRTVGC